MTDRSYRWCSLRTARDTARHSFVALIACCCASFGLIGEASAQTNVIPIRSGNGAVGKPDAGVILTIGSLSSDGTPARMLGHAVVAGGTGDAAVRLDTDPTARAIGVPPGDLQGGDAIRFTSAFTVNHGLIAAANLEFTARADVAHGGAVSVGLLLNGRWIADVPLPAPDNPDEWSVVENLAPLLNPGVNRLAIELPSGSDGARLNFSARVNIRRPEIGPKVERRMKLRSVREPETGSAAGNVGPVCVGFTCRQRGDLDSINGVDLADYVLFMDCLSGTGSPAADNCEYADLDCDTDVDLGDTALLQNAFVAP